MDVPSDAVSPGCTPEEVPALQCLYTRLHQMYMEFIDAEDHLVLPRFEPHLQGASNDAMIGSWS